MRPQGFGCVRGLLGVPRTAGAVAAGQAAAAAAAARGASPQEAANCGGGGRFLDALRSLTLHGDGRMVDVGPKSAGWEARTCVQSNELIRYPALNGWCVPWVSLDHYGEARCEYNSYCPFCCLDALSIGFLQGLCSLARLFLHRVLRYV